MTQRNDPLQFKLDRCLEALVEKDRLSFIGNLVQGLIHNVNGPLQNMSMLVEVLMKGQGLVDQLAHAPSLQHPEEWDKLSTKQNKRLEQLSQQITSLAEMLRDFMVLMEIERNETEVDVNLVLTKLAGMFRADLFYKHQVNLDLRLTKNLPLVRVLGRHLIPALLHLFRNAINAMRGTAEKRLTVESRLESGMIRILLRDTGCGFNDTPIECCFDLFHSNWPVSTAREFKDEKHLGFGLYTARHLLAPYGVKVRLEREEAETLAILDIPLPS